MTQRVVASFLLRLIHEPDNEQIPWNLYVQHIQSGRVYRLTGVQAIVSLLQEVINEEEARFQPVIFRKPELSSEGNGAWRRQR